MPSGASCTGHGVFTGCSVAVELNNDRDEEGRCVTGRDVLATVSIPSAESPPLCGQDVADAALWWRGGGLDEVSGPRSLAALLEPPRGAVPTDPGGVVRPREDIASGDQRRRHRGGRRRAWVDFLGGSATGWYGCVRSRRP